MIFEVVTFAVAMLAMVLHFVSKKTANTVDDKAAAIVDKVAEYLPLSKPLFPAAKVPADATMPVDPAKEIAGFKP